MVVCPAYTLFGYNQSGLGSLVSLSDWDQHFPAIDTDSTEGAEASHNATIRGVVIATFTLGALPAVCPAHTLPIDSVDVRRSLWVAYSP
jgi:hypothetical protein